MKQAIHQSLKSLTLSPKKLVKNGKGGIFLKINPFLKEGKIMLRPHFHLQFLIPPTFIWDEKGGKKGAKSRF